MPEDKTIKNFSAADIERYWTKRLSAAAMHDMEKAAMDDPFLADALEGYRHSGNVDEELKKLNDRFHRNLSEATAVVPIYRKKYAWLRVAAAIIILLGTGLLVQQLVLKNKSQVPIVSVDKTSKNKNADTAKPDEPASASEDRKDRPDSAVIDGPVAAKKPKIKNDSVNANAVDLNTSYAFTTIDSLKSDDKKSNVVADKNTEVVQNSIGDLAKEGAKKEKVEEKKPAYPEAVVSQKADKRSEVNAYYKSKSAADDMKQTGLLANTYNYRVVDAQNNPVPFANVLNTRDNVGTYTDVRGYFNLVSSDSVLDVQVRSLGYNSENYKLTPSRQNNTLILKEDATARNFIDINKDRRVMNSAVRKDSAEVEEPEVGWGNYNTYVENNIKIPENVRARKALNEVELSFNVDRSGTPINIKVTKSSQCKECDEEAIRLLKEGPKWKKKGKRSKTTISISVDK